MKRLMQAMLAVALVLVTAFTFYIDTASAQPVSAPVAAANISCLPTQVCTIPPSGRCTFTRTGQIIQLTLRNLDNFAAAQAIIALGSQNQSVTILPGGTFQQVFSPGRADIVVYNLSNSISIQGSFVNLVADPGK